MSAESQYANVHPPVEGKIIAVTLDATSRRYDLGALALGDAGVERGGTMFLTLISTVLFYYKFHDANAGTADETSADAAAAPLTFQALAVALAPANTPIRVRVNRKSHRYLIVKASAGILRIWVSSDASTR